MRNFFNNPPMPTYIVMPNPPKHHPISVTPFDEETKSEEIVTAAEKLETARKIALSGDASGAAIFDGTDDATIKVTVKNSARATRDAKGNVINETYAKKSDLDGYVKKEDVTARLNNLEKVLYETKNAANSSLREEDVNIASAADILDLF